MQSKAQQAAVARYNAKTYKRIDLRIKFDLDERIRNHIAATGESLNGFITAAIIARLEAATPPEEKPTE